MQFDYLPEEILFQKHSKLSGCGYLHLLLVIQLPAIAINHSSECETTQINCVLQYVESLVLLLSLDLDVLTPLTFGPNGIQIRSIFDVILLSESFRQSKAECKSTSMIVTSKFDRNMRIQTSQSRESFMWTIWICNGPFAANGYGKLLESCESAVDNTD